MNNSQSNSDLKFFVELLLYFHLAQIFENIPEVILLYNHKYKEQFIEFL